MPQAARLPGREERMIAQCYKFRKRSRHTLNFYSHAACFMSLRLQPQQMMREVVRELLQRRSHIYRILIELSKAGFSLHAGTFEQLCPS